MVAHVLGLQIVEVSIESDEDSVGRCTVQPPRSRAQAKAALVYLAAGWTCKGEHHLPELTAVAAWSDVGQAKRLSREWLLDDPKTWIDVQHLSRLLLRKYATEVRLLTDALLSITRLTGDDVQDLLDCTCRMAEQR